MTNEYLNKTQLKKLQMKKNKGMAKTRTKRYKKQSIGAKLTYARNQLDETLHLLNIDIASRKRRRQSEWKRLWTNLLAKACCLSSDDYRVKDDRKPISEYTDDELIYDLTSLKKERRGSEIGSIIGKYAKTNIFKDLFPSGVKFEALNKYTFTLNGQFYGAGHNINYLKLMNTFEYLLKNQYKRKVTMILESGLIHLHAE